MYHFSRTSCLFHAPTPVDQETAHCLWTPRQEVLADARQAGQLPDDRMLFEGANYLSPDLPRSFMEELIAARRSHKGYTVQVNQPYAGYRWESSRETTKQE